MIKKPFQDHAFLSGDEALAQGAYEAGLRVAASYPGTPATEILEYLAKFKEIDSQWSVNEKVAYEVALGAAIGGSRSLYASKHVGINVAMDPLMTSAYTGIEAGFVVVSCDDPGLHSSQNEQDNRFIARLAQIPLLEPSSPREAREFAAIAFGISERFDIPVMLRLTTRIAHTKENLRLGPRRSSPVKPFSLRPEKYVMVPANAAKRHAELLRRISRLKAYAEKTRLNQVEIKSKKMGFVASGVSYLYAKEMYPEASFLKLGLSFPFPDEKVKQFARTVKKIYVIEELEPFLADELARFGVVHAAKHASFQVGELKPEYIPHIVKGTRKPKEKTVSRKPVMCPGCPHRPVFLALKKLKTVVTGDIGCYTLGALPPLSSLHTCLCMGSGITFFEGFKRAHVSGKVVGVIGDSTFVHSGIAGLINLAYNKMDGVIIILDNGTTAMTGSQPHPATGVTIQGEPSKKLKLERLCLACGADNVDVVDPHDLCKLEGLLQKRLQEDALSVVIAQSRCRLLDKTKKEPVRFISKDCRRCYACLALDCPALKKGEDGNIVFDPLFCVGCGLCVSFCRFGALRHETK